MRNVVPRIADAALAVEDAPKRPLDALDGGWIQLIPEDVNCASGHLLGLHIFRQSQTFPSASFSHAPLAAASCGVDLTYIATSWPTAPDFKASHKRNPPQYGIRVP